MAFEQLAEELFEEIDSAMGCLWDGELERRALRSTCTASSLLEAEPIEARGIVRIWLDIESETAAETVSSLVDGPVLAVSQFGDAWLRLGLYEKGKRRAWIFWASAEWLDERDGEIEPALAGAARASGGWLGDADAFGLLLSAHHSVSDLRDILNGEIADAKAFASAFFRLCEAPELV